MYLDSLGVCLCLELLQMNFEFQITVHIYKKDLMLLIFALFYVTSLMYKHDCFMKSSHRKYSSCSISLNDITTESKMTK